MPKTFLLTGSSRGLGRSIACAVLDAGHQLVATARNPEKLQDLVERHGDRILPVALDVTDYAAAKRAVALGVARFGRLEVVVNNAGFANGGSVEDMPPAAIEAQFATNFMGSVHVIKSALPILRAQGSGRLIQISSIGARIATAGAAAYYATKWALSGFVESLAWRWRRWASMSRPSSPRLSILALFDRRAGGAPNTRILHSPTN